MSWALCLLRAVGNSDLGLNVLRSQLWVLQWPLSQIMLSSELDEGSLENFVLNLLAAPLKLLLAGRELGCVDQASSENYCFLGCISGRKMLQAAAN